MHTTTVFTQLQEAFTKHIHSLPATHGWKKAQQEAYHAFQQLGLPHAKTEAYKNTPITSVLSEKFNLSDVPIALDEPSVEIEALLQQTFNNYPIVLVNGMISKRYTPINLLHSSFQVYTFDEAYTQHPDLLMKHFAQCASDKLDIFTFINTALFKTGIMIYIPDNMVLDKPLHIYNITDAATQKTISYPRLLIATGKNSQLSIINSWHTLGENEGFTNAVTDIIVGPYTQLDCYTLQTQLGNAYQINNIHYYQNEHSVVNNYVFSWDGILIRNNLHIAIQASHAEANMYGLYCLNNTQHIDNHTLVDHQQSHTASNELYKGIIGGNATGVFNGRIYVQPEAQKTNAFQANNNILLSDQATIHTKPQLEIWADDVKCSHGATIGQLDESQLFYLQSRGIPEGLAKHMLLESFADEVISKINLLPLQEYLRKDFKDQISQLA
ncbi:MAG: Fe-S cluster assembly protein SufD [Candidatus Amoebophilus sp.]